MTHDKGSNAITWLAQNFDNAQCIPFILKMLQARIKYVIKYRYFSQCTNDDDCSMYNIHK